ncbi:MAG: SRPBCC domain-containing protein [Patescibacteria group bacterium]
MNKLTVETTVNSPIKKVWECWTMPEHITQWAFATNDWEAPSAENDVRVGGKFKTSMSAKDKSAAFDFKGVYTAVEEFSNIEYDMEDGRHVSITFTETPTGVKIIEIFDPESENPEDAQIAGWQAFLNNFKKHTEQSK